MDSFSLAHLSDLHLPLAAGRPPLRQLMGKRLFSYLSWLKSRRRIHRPEVLAAVMDDLRRHAPSHVVVTGDLVNLAAPDEFDRARDWLQGLGEPEHATAAPGNHDALVPVRWSDGLGKWAPWMGAAAGKEAFPFVKRCGPVALVGVSTAVPTAPFLASGRIGEAQLQRLEVTLRMLREEGLFRVILLHHPITDGAVPGRKALNDRAQLRALLGRVGAELVLHGHSHHATTNSVQGPDGAIPVVAAPSASAAPGESSEPAGWRWIQLRPVNDAWELQVATRSMGPSGDFTTAQTFATRVARPN